MTPEISELVRELQDFVAAAPHDYPGHNVALFERAISGLQRLSELRVEATERGDRYHEENNELFKRAVEADKRAEKFAAQLVQLQKGIQDYLDGSYGRAQYFKSKNDKCPHGLFGWEACENCIDGHFSRLLALVSSPVTEKTDG